MTTHLSKIHMKNNDWKERLNVVYSTNPDFNYEHGEEEETATPDKKQQKLRVSIEKKGRGGKTVSPCQWIYRALKMILKGNWGKLAHEPKMWCGRFCERWKIIIQESSNSGLSSC